MQSRPRTAAAKKRRVRRKAERRGIKGTLGSPGKVRR